MARSPLQTPASCGALGLLAAALLGCASGWHVVAQSSPAAFAGQGRIGVVSIDYAGVRAGKKTEGASLAEDQASLDERFIQALRAEARSGGIEIVRSEGAADAPFVIRPSISVLDPGSGSSQVSMDVKIVGADGRVLDEITLSHGSEGPSGGRLRADGEALGAMVAGYVRERVGRVTTSPPAEEPTEAPAPRPAPPPPPPSTAAPEVSLLLPPPPPPPPPPKVKGRRFVPAPRVPRGKRPVVEPIAPGTPIASSPSFSRLDDGTSRIWMEVSSRVEVIETRYRGRAVYRIRGAVMIQHNSHLPLPTGYFTTPIERIQLAQVGTDLDLTIDLREDLTPVYRVVETPRGMVLQVDLPRSALFQRDDKLEPGGRPRASRSRSSHSLGTDAKPGDPPPSED